MATAVASGVDSSSRICGVCREQVDENGLATDKHVYHQDCFV